MTSILYQLNLPAWGGRYDLLEQVDDLQEFAKLEPVAGYGHILSYGRGQKIYDLKTRPTMTLIDRSPGCIHT